MLGIITVGISWNKATSEMGMRPRPSRQQNYIRLKSPTPAAGARVLPVHVG